MGQGLNFKLEEASSVNTVGDMSQGQVLPLIPLRSPQPLLVSQREHSMKSLGLIENEKKRWKHIFDFAEHHQTVFTEECDNFHKNNPGVFEEDLREIKKEKKSIMKAKWSSSVLGGIFAVATMWVDDSAVSQASGMVALGMMFTVICVLITVLSCLFEYDMKDAVENKVKTNKDDFLRMFLRDKNLADLWVQTESPVHDFSVLCKQVKTIKQKHLDKINAYVETSRWLQQWGRGDESNLSQVEWDALRGIVKKYKKYLTAIEPVQKPQDSDHECMRSAS